MYSSTKFDNTLHGCLQKKQKVKKEEKEEEEKIFFQRNHFINKTQTL